MKRTTKAWTALALTALVITGCSSQPTGPGAATAPASPEPGGTSAPPTRNPSAQPRYTTAPAALDGTVTYSDNVEVTLASDETRTVNETGPGAITGREARTLTIKVKNGSASAIDMNRVEVTLAVSSGSADPYPSQDAQTFAGMLKPGATATGTYSFLLPESGADTVMVTVDFADQYAPAVFTA